MFHAVENLFNWMCFWHHAICHSSTSLPTRIIEPFGPSGISLLQVNNRNTTTRCEMCSKLTIKTPQHHELTSFRCLYCKLYTHFTTCLAFELLTLNMQLFAGQLSSFCKYMQPCEIGSKSSCSADSKKDV